MAMSVAKMTLGVAAGLVLAYAVPLLWIGGARPTSAEVAWASEMREAEAMAAKPRLHEMIDVANARATEPEPATTKSGLAVPVETWLRTHRWHAPDPNTLKAESLFWDDRCGWCQTVVFDDDRTHNSAVFSVHGDAARVEWQGREMPVDHDALVIVN